MTFQGNLLVPASLLAFAAVAAAQDGQPDQLHPSLTDGTGQPGYQVEVVYINETGHPKNVVPGLGIPFRAGTFTSSAFRRPQISANDQHVGIRVIADTATTDDDEALLVDGSVVLREGDAAAFAAAGETVGPISSDFGLNNSGDVLIHNTTGGVGANAGLLYVIRYDGSSWTKVVREGESISSFVSGPVGGAGGTWINDLDTCRLLADGTPWWHANGVSGLSTGFDNDTFLVFGDGTYLQEGVDIPLNQAGGAMETWQNFDSEMTQVSADGSTWIVRGKVEGSFFDDRVVAVNNSVVVQVGSVLAGSSFPNPVDPTGIEKTWLDRGNNWYVRGDNDNSGTDWVYRNGVVVAQSDGTQEVVAGSGEHWDDTSYQSCFFAFDGNTSGAYVIGGVTDAASDQDGVLVYFDGLGGSVVVAREGDAVDLDGNGLFDDDRFLDTFGNDDCLLREDGTIIFVASLRDGAGVDQSNGLFRITTPSPECTLRNGSGINPQACQCATAPRIGTDWDVTVDLTASTIQTWVLASPTPLPVPVPLFGGEALIAPPVTAAPATTPGMHRVTLPNDFALLGFQISLQGLRMQVGPGTLTLELTNALDATVGQ